MLRARGLGLLRGERVLVRGVGLSVAAGEAMVLRGANGSGKTTLLRALAGLARPDAGTVEREAAHHWLGHRTGLKPHESPLRHLRVWAAAWGAAPEAAERAFGQSGLPDAARAVPAAALSQGQRQRVALARLALVERPLWLLDEPYTALDAEGRASAATMLQAHLAGGGAVVAALHGESGLPRARELRL